MKLKAVNPPSICRSIPAAKQRVYWTAIALASLACGSFAPAQTATNDLVPALPMPKLDTQTNVLQLKETTVVGHLDDARNQILPNLGATAYTINAAQITAGSQGADAPLNQVILRAPGVAQDSAANGDLHVRGEHGNLQYRINDVLLPEGISGFGLELDPRFVESLQLITGALPAQYGFRTAGIVDIQTKTGAFENGGQAEVYGGSHDTIRPSFEYGGSHSNLNYFVDASFDHNSLGIENTTSAHEAIHDKTDQAKLFSYVSYILDDTSRVNFMLSGSESKFQVPNTPGQGTGNDGGVIDYGTFLGTTFDSSTLDERQYEQNYYAVATYQKSAGDFNMQLSAIGRDSSVHFLPDSLGDLYFNGVSSDVYRRDTSGGLQLDMSYAIGDSHTVRGGAIFDGEFVRANSSIETFTVDGAGNPTGFANFSGGQNIYGLFTGFYLQDEWKVLDQVTINYGGRFDIFNSSFDNENQLSPRVNLIYKPFDKTTFHAGYARYFTPPPVENVPNSDVTQFNGTANQAQVTASSGVQAERADYFDVGATQELFPGFRVGVDGYYKKSKNQLDDGLFGQTLILSAFNYSQGEIYGTEFTFNYTKANFSAYANIAYSVARGKDFSSSQFLFSANDLAYSKNNWIALDHDQSVSGSFGMSYRFVESDRYNTLVYVDALYGSGLRADGGGTEDGLPGGDPIPNGTTVPSYYTLNTGVEQSFRLCKKQYLKARIDLVNITDNAYELRDGSGVGVNAAQYGARRGIFGSVSYVF